MTGGSSKGFLNAGLGSRREDIAASLLTRNGLTIIERNFRCKGGEVDIIAADRECIVFVEVKTRRSLSFSAPQLAVTPFKQRQISKAALTWLARNNKCGTEAHFDVIAILLEGDYSQQIEHIKNAFELAY